jgi:Asp-tRNA(Asn)/Glu-tRNA(Gln) amidotransferase A subunit family amidase
VVIEIDLGDDFNTLVQTATWGIFAHETMGAISEFLRRHNIPTTFQAIYDGLKPQLRQAWGHIVLPSGAGAVSAEAYQTALNVSRPEIQRRLNKAFAADGAQIILQPTTPCTAPSIEEQATVRIAGQDVSYLVVREERLSD